MNENIIAMLQSEETAKKIRQAVQDAKSKYKPLDDWRRTAAPPQNLLQAVIQMEAYKVAYEKVYGPGSY